jgi:cytochrome b561
MRQQLKELGMRKQTGQFSASAKWLHWLVVFFMFSLIAEAMVFKWVPPEERATAIPAHVAVGLIILGLTLARLAVRAVMPPPPLPVDSQPWMKLGAHVGHLLLYGIILYMAAIGIVMAAVSPVDIRVFSAFNISAFGPERPEWLPILRQFHFAGAVAFLLVLIGHVCAALWHHFVIRDDILIRMLPFSGLVQRTLAQGKIPAWRFPTSNKVDWHDRRTWFRDNSGSV